MHMNGRLDPGRPAGVVDAKQILWRSDWWYGTNFGYLSATWGRSTLRSKGEKPYLTGRLGRETGWTGCGLRLFQRGKIIDPPEQWTGRQLFNLLLGDRLDQKFLRHRAEW